MYDTVRFYIIMASEEHKRLAQYLKSVHSSLRTTTSLVGAEIAWEQHCKNSVVLKEYAISMQKLATTHWEINCAKKSTEAISRIKWTADFCLDYFSNTITAIDDKEIEIGKKIGIHLSNNKKFISPYKLLDVGSCYNPFKVYDFLDVCAIDLCPANTSVYQCDFININIGLQNIYCDNKFAQIQEESFDVVAFCFVLEYIPSSELRIKACSNAYKVLKKGGLMIIITPDSKHATANSKLMKCWRYSLACLGFNRIKYEKLPHMHCMAFRKSLHEDIAKRWALLHKQDYMDYKMSLSIPQDFKTNDKDDFKKDDLNLNNLYVNDFTNMPFCNIFLEND